MELLPDEFDAVVVGTGLVESLLAAALARSGERVLHVDKNDHYGADFAGFNLATAKRWVNACVEERNDAPPPDVLETVAAKLELPIDQLELCDGYCANQRTEKVHSFFDGAAEPRRCSDSEELADAAIRAALIELELGNSRSYNIDLEVRLMFASGPTVDALVALGVADYLEFASVRSLKCKDREVPSSKTDLFNSKSLSFTEKRKLMRMMQHGLDSLMDARAETLNERELTSSRALKRPQNKKAAVVVVDQARQQQRDTFVETLVEDFELPPETARLVCGALAFVPPTASPSEGWQGVHRHLRALGAHVGAATALLAPVYGTAEIPQALCRACAVCGGVYALRCPPSAFVRDKISHRVVCALFADGQIVKCNKVVVGPDFYRRRSSEEGTQPDHRVYRHVSIVESDETEPMAIVYDRNVRCAILGPSTNAVAEPYLRLVYFASDNLDALRDTVAQTRTARGPPLWSVEFSFPVQAENEEDPSHLLADNLVAVRRLPSAVHFDIYQEIDQARLLFATLCDGRPLYPNPDEENEQEAESRDQEERQQPPRRVVVEEDDDDLNLAELVGRLELRKAMRSEEGDESKESTMTTTTTTPAPGGRHDESHNSG